MPTKQDIGPTFLVGAERSGTTLLRLMLDHHPRLAVLSEFEYAVDPLAASPGRLPPASVLRRRVAGDRIFARHARLLGLRLDETIDGYAEAADDLLRQVVARRPGATHPLAVVHRHADELPRLFPDARYVHIVRDPRDVARSTIGMGWAGNVYHGVARWIEAERQWDRLRPRLDPRRVYELRQERLIHDPEATLVGLCEFLGVDYDPAMMRYCDATTYARPDPSLTEQWRRKLTAAEVGLVEARVGELLAARGYEPSGHPPVRPGLTGRAWLAGTDKLGRLRHRVQLYGPVLFAEDVLSRRLRVGRWQRTVRPKVVAVGEATLK